MATTLSVSAWPGAASNAKRAAKIADLIVEDVMARGWPVGEVLGSEADLRSQFQVSRSVLREAIRLVENQQVARTRRGPGGGLFITEPTVGAVIDAVVLYLHRVDARLDELFEARIVLEEIACETASSSLSESDVAQLRTFADGKQSDLATDPRALHKAIASMSRNPALELFIDVLGRVTMLYSVGWQNYGKAAKVQTEDAHARIAEAVISGNPKIARNRMRKHLEAEADYLRSRSSTRQSLPDGFVFAEHDQTRLAEAVARDITRAVVDEGMRPGDLVGSETELIEQEGVSRSVFREAIRLLEYHQIVHMRRGPGGGLFVSEPDAAAVTDIAAIYLARQGMQRAELAELRIDIEEAIVDLAADRIDAYGVDLINEALVREATSSENQRIAVVHDVHVAVAAAAQNRVLELVALVLIRLSRLHQFERQPPAHMRHQVHYEVLRAHEAIASAVKAGDRHTARRRMRRHLEAIGVAVR
jgi:DNA-binding FadR family transcriptional regulator